MATALKEPDLSPREEALPGPSPNALLSSINETEVGEMGDTDLTQKIVVRELGFVPLSDRGPFGYISRGLPYTYSAGGLISILTQLRNGSFQANGSLNPGARPLDLTLNEQTCFVLFMRSLGDANCDWRFSTEAKAIMLGDFKTYDSEKSGYFNLRHVHPGGGESPDHYAPGDQCRIVYFFAKRPTRTEFFHPININIEMVYPPDQAGNKNTVPIIIDPDIRYPGQ